MHMSAIAHRCQKKLPDPLELDWQLGLLLNLFHTLHNTFYTWLDLAAGFVLVYQNLYHLLTSGLHSDKAALGVSMGPWKEVDDGREEERARLGEHEVHFMVFMAVKS